MSVGRRNGTVEILRRVRLRAARYGGLALLRMTRFFFANIRESSRLVWDDDLGFVGTDGPHMQRRHVGHPQDGEKNQLAASEGGPLATIKGGKMRWAEKGRQAATLQRTQAQACATD